MNRFGPFPRVVVAAVLVLASLLPACLRAAPLTPQPPAMRPYAGIGVLLLAPALDEPGVLPRQLPLYDEPAIYRRGVLEIPRVPRHASIFGPDGGQIPLIVMARKGAWSRVVYDDAGREAWIDPGRRGTYYAWDSFFVARSGFLLPGLQKRLYQLFRAPGSEPLISLSPGQVFGIAGLEGDWIRLVANDRNPEGWLRWRDEDGRLLIGCEAWKELPVRQQGEIGFRSGFADDQNR